MIDSIGVDFNPTTGILSIPCVGVGYCQNPYMDLRKTLATNVNTLMKARHMKNNLDLVSASETRLSNGKIGRIRAASHTTDVDSLEELAKTLHVAPWQLLVPGLNPSALPTLSNASLLSEIKELFRQNNQSSKLVKTLEQDFEVTEYSVTRKLPPGKPKPVLVETAQEAIAPAKRAYKKLDSIGKPLDNGEKKHGDHTVRGVQKQGNN